MRIIGIDPGLRGAISGLDTSDKILWAVEMPIVENDKGKSDYDIPRIAALLRAFNPDHVCLESVHSMPRDGVRSAFSFGKGYGTLLGIVVTLGIPLTCVSPRTWKGKYKLGADKNTSRERATELFPHCAAFWKLKKHEGLSEASILATYLCTEDLEHIAPGNISDLYDIQGNQRVRAKRKVKS